MREVLGNPEHPEHPVKKIRFRVFRVFRGFDQCPSVVTNEEAGVRFDFS